MDVKIQLTLFSTASGIIIADAMKFYLFKFQIQTNTMKFEDNAD